jgi:hypothetical protein
VDHSLGVRVEATTYLDWYPAKKQIVAAWPNWYPIDGRKVTLCGKQAKAPEVHPGPLHEYDWNIFITPHDRFFDLLQQPAWLFDAKIESCNGVPCMEAEVTPPRKYRTPTQFLNPTNGQLPDICVFGPWVRETAHGSRPEIHPMEMLWTREEKNGLHRLLAVEDRSKRFDRTTDYWFGSPRSEAVDGWRPWTATGRSKFQIAVRVPSGGPTTFSLEQAQPIPPEPRHQVLGSASLPDGTLLRVSTSSATDTQVELRPVCSADGQVHFWLDVEATGLYQEFTLRQGELRQANVRDLEPVPPAVQFRVVPKSLLARRGTVLCDVEVLREPEQSGVIVQIESSTNRVGRSADSATTNGLRIFDVDMFRGFALTVTYREGAESHTRAIDIPGVDFAVSIRSEAATSEARLRYRAEPSFVSKGEDSFLTEKLNGVVINCLRSKDDTNCPSFVRFRTEWEPYPTDDDLPDLALRPTDVGAASGSDVEVSAAVAGLYQKRGLQLKARTTFNPTWGYQITAEDVSDVASEPVNESVIDGLTRDVLAETGVSEPRLSRLLEFAKGRLDGDGQDAGVRRLARMLRMAAARAAMEKRQKRPRDLLRGIAIRLRDADLPP